MIRQKITFFSLLLLLGGSSAPDLLAQGRLQLGISTQLHNTKMLVDLASTGVKGAWRPANIIFAEYDLGKRWGLHAGLGHAMMTQNSDAFKNNFHYLALPLHLKIGGLKPDRTLAFTSFIGLDFHYLLKANHISRDGVETDIMEHAQLFHTDITGGIGLKGRLSDRLCLEGFFSLSYGSNINAYNAVLMDITNFNKGFRLNLAYRF